MPWGVAAAAIGAAGSLGAAAMGGGSSGQSSQANSAPWTAQQPYLTGGFSTANNILQRQQSTPFYGGELYAGLNPSQLAAITGLNNYASGQGANTAGALTGAGASALNGVSASGGNASSIFNRTMADPTNQIASDAATLANNPYTQGMIKSAITPIQQQLTEQALPALNANAAGTGNGASTRAGIAQAILQRDAGTQEANVAADILGSQYTNGLNTAAGLYGTNLSGALNANNTLLNSGTAGASLLDQGYNTTLNNLNIPLQTGALQQQNQQGQDAANYAQWQAQQQYPWQSLDNYWNIVGGNGYGGSSQGTTMNNPSMLSAAMGGLGSGLGMYQVGKMNGWWGGPSNSGGDYALPSTYTGMQPNGSEYNSPIGPTVPSGGWLSSLFGG